MVLTFGMSSSDFISGGVSPRVFVEVESSRNGKTILSQYSQEFVPGETVRVDISSHVGKVFAREDADGAYEAVKCDLEVWTECLVNGVIRTKALIATKQLNPFGGSIYGIKGAFSEGMRIENGWKKPQDVLDSLDFAGSKLLLTFKPWSGEVMPVGTKVVMNYFDTSTKQSESAEIEADYLKHKYGFDDNVNRVEMRFVNSFGVVENVSALVGSEKYDNGSEEFTMVGNTSFAPSAKMSSKGTGTKASLGMTSGYVAREWARWWITEFLPQQGRLNRYWIKAKGGAWLPVTIKATSSTVFDKDKDGMASVAFEVTSAVDGIAEIV